jgi:sugar/nucleoside kinase (ribokinase family)
MTNTPELRERCAQQLLAAASKVPTMSAFVGVDGFVDEILHVVDKRESATQFTRVPTIANFAERLAGAAGRSTNVELVCAMRKLGGNGPIMANALASFGLQVTYIGNLGYPNLHPVFASFAKRAEIHSIAQPGFTDALEFEDGKIMVGKHESLKEVTWENIQNRWSRDQFEAKFAKADFIGFVNWTMIPFMSDLWAVLLSDLCVKLNGSPRRTIFFDLADPEKRLPQDIKRALELITAFEKYFDVILGLNEKEAYEIAKVLGIKEEERTPEGLSKMGVEIRKQVPVRTLVIHPVAYALSVTKEGVAAVKGPHTPKPKITTGAGDHFNSGFCLGKLLGLDDECCVLTGVSTSGFYVRSGESPTVEQLAGLMRNWPND